MAKAKADDVTPLLAEEGGVRQRTSEAKKKAAAAPATEPPSDWNPNLPYGGKVYLARKKKPDPWWVTTLEVSRAAY